MNYNVPASPDITETDTYGVNTSLRLAVLNHTYPFHPSCLSNHYSFKGKR